MRKRQESKLTGEEAAMLGTILQWNAAIAYRNAGQECEDVAADPDEVARARRRYQALAADRIATDEV